MQIIEKPPREGMRVSHTQVLSARIADARATIGSSIQRSQRARLLAAHVAETVGAENLVFIAEAVIQPEIEGILIVHLSLISQIVVGEIAGSSEVRQWIKVGDIRTHVVDQSRVDHIRLAIE